MQKSISSYQHKILIPLLKQIRIDAGLKQVELAQKLGKHQSFVSKYESGERQLDILELRYICNTLDISFIDFSKKLEERLK